MRIVGNNIAVLDRMQDGVLSCLVERDRRLDYDLAIGEKYTPLIPEGGWVVDAGAAIGDHTCSYLQKAGPSGRVFAFEPNPLMFECLAHNCPSAVLSRSGLAYKFGNWSVHHENLNAGASYLVEDAKGEIACLPLDSLELERLDFFKLDVEGMEMLALAGAQETIVRCRPVIVLEINPPALARYGGTATQIKEFFARIGYAFAIFMGEESNEHYEMIARPS